MRRPRPVLPLRPRALRPLALAGAAALLLAGCGGDGGGSGGSGTATGGSGTAAGGATPGATAAAADCAPGALDTLEGGTLTLGTSQPAYEPWMVGDDPANGQGYESAVAYAVAEELGYAREDVAWVRVPFDAAVQPGPKPFDAALNQFSITPERQRAVDFSSPYYDVRQAVVTLEGSPAAGADSLAELRGVRLGAQVGTTSLRAVEEAVSPESAPAVFTSNDDAKLALANGQVDAIVVDLPTAFYLTAAELDGGVILGQLPQLDEDPEQFGMVLDLGSPLTGCVSAAVDALREDGTLAELQQQWLADVAGAPELS
ncbi:transporter substrate-binding domain-containing protein [Vallicoccus soli]|uniref:Amino acid ABC transporter substrate-binding protein n=1 Tax=Vallicoccus soli TaxID=2339232 RepID=A0A3A3ZK05_9ACTN|nr:transporter substrate-binding domain-containing protein [Vallicoccus soli]RJK96103.1 amino acid ABC transporter substrate-binding protein [Vallicoccus soli]